MNYFDSNRTNTVIFNHSWTVCTQHLVAVPFTSFGNFELILNYLYLNEIFKTKIWMLKWKNIYCVFSNIDSISSIECDVWSKSKVKCSVNDVIDTLESRDRTVTCSAGSDVRNESFREVTSGMWGFWEMTFSARKWLQRKLGNPREQNICCRFLAKIYRKLPPRMCCLIIGYR
jgi:hypothetical protein